MALLILVLFIFVVQTVADAVTHVVELAREKSTEVVRHFQDKSKGGSFMCDCGTQKPSLCCFLCALTQFSVCQVLTWLVLDSLTFQPIWVAVLVPQPSLSFPLAESMSPLGYLPLNLLAVARKPFYTVIESLDCGTCLPEIIVPPAELLILYQGLTRSV